MKQATVTSLACACIVATALVMPTPASALTTEHMAPSMAISAIKHPTGIETTKTYTYKPLSSVTIQYPKVFQKTYDITAPSKNFTGWKRISKTNNKNLQKVWRLDNFLVSASETVKNWKPYCYMVTTSKAQLEVYFKNGTPTKYRYVKVGYFSTKSYERTKNHKWDPKPWARYAISHKYAQTVPMLVGAKPTKDTL